MINVRYVNDIPPMHDDISNIYENSVSALYEEIEPEMNKLLFINKRYMFESEILGESNFIITEAEQKDIFTKIGETIIKAGKLFMETIQKIIDKIKGLGFKNKTNSEKLEVLIKKNPSFANEIKVAYDKGSLDLNDIRSLKELNDTWDEIYKLSKRADVDENTLKGKWNKALNKFDKDSNTWKIVKVATATSAVIGAAVAIKTFIPKCKEAQQKAEELRRKDSQEQQILLDYIDDNNANSQAYGKLRLLLEMHRVKRNKTAQVCNNRYNALQRMTNNITSAIDNFSPNSGQNYRDSLRMSRDIENRRRGEENNRKAEEARSVERAKQEERRAANSQPLSQGELDNIARTAETQARARANANNGNNP